MASTSIVSDAVALADARKQHAKMPIKYSRHAMHTYTVLSLEQGKRRIDAAIRCLPILRQKRDRMSSATWKNAQERMRISSLMVRLATRLWLVELEGTRYYISTSVLVDWRQNRISYTVIQRPQHLGINVRDRKEPIALHDKVLHRLSSGRKYHGSMDLANRIRRAATLAEDSEVYKVCNLWMQHGDYDTAVRAVFGHRQDGTERSNNDLRSFAEYILFRYYEPR